MTASLTLRQVKGLDLTFAEMDNNFIFLRDSKMQVFNAEANGAHHMDEVGYATLDAAPLIQATIDQASQYALSGKNWSTYGRFGAVVYVNPARWQLRSQLVIKPGVILLCDGIFWNAMTDQYSPAVVFQAGSHCRRLLLNANGRAGVEFGQTNIASDMKVGEVRVWGTGVSTDGVLGPQTGVRFKGSNFEVDNLTIDGGATALDLSSTTAVRVREVSLREPMVGFRIAGAERISVGAIRLESPATLGGMIDSSTIVRIQSILATNDDTRVSAPCSSGYLLNIGSNSANSIVEGVEIDQLQSTNTGGTALKVSNIRRSHIGLALSSAKLASGNNNPIKTAIEYGAGIDSLHIDGEIEASITPFVGAKSGTLMFANGKTVVGAGTGLDSFSYNVPTVNAGATFGVDLTPMLETFGKQTLVFEFVGVSIGTQDPYRIELVETNGTTETVVYSTTSITGALRDARPFTIDKLVSTDGIKLKFYNLSTNAISTAVVKLVVTGV